MEYFGRGTLEQKVMDMMEGVKDAHNLTNVELVGIMNKVVEFYRDGMVYDFDEDEYPTLLEPRDKEKSDEEKS